jgi:hypothetical protein
VHDVWTLGVTDSAGIGAASDACDDEHAPRLSFIGGVASASGTSARLNLDRIWRTTDQPLTLKSSTVTRNAPIAISNASFPDAEFPAPGLLFIDSSTIAGNEGGSPTQARRASSTRQSP